MPWPALSHFEHLLCALCQAEISKCRPQFTGCSVTWLCTPKLEPHTLCELWAQGDTGVDPWLEVARGSWNSWELPEPPSGSGGERRREIKGQGGSREQQAAAASLSLCRPGLLVCVHVWLCVHASKHGDVDMWVCVASAEVPGPLCCEVWPGLTSRYRDGEEFEQ